ncbi:hypothetical protein QGM71_10370 [Virgibacillus sp. C22-A2]|uniref:Uncharacterized protein n=1 Tax=Virgibacillus tibetensis TaxID=3042313 RepID=A0ABU6KGB0_9BACI|nr:hypothetical protein [Virgibacillus sp. C22-A2]
METIVYIADNFFSAGKTVIKDQNNQNVGFLDLRSAFSSAVSLYDLEESLLASGQFKTFSNQWIVSDKNEDLLGTLKTSWFSFSKKYTYTTSHRGIYTISSPAFSRDFSISDEKSDEVATFKRTNHFFSSRAYEVNNFAGQMTTEELIVVVMGVNALEKRKQGAAANGGGAN